MKKWTCLFSVTLFSLLSTLLVAQVRSEPKPLMVLVEHDPWAMALGFDVPSFVLYDDGLAIFRNRREKPTSDFLYVRLSPEYLKEFLEPLSLESPFFSWLKTDYSLSNWTDQPTTDLFVWRKGKRKSFQIYGYRRKDEATAKALPERLRRILEQVEDYNPAAAKAWSPEKLEIFIWPYEYSPMKPLEWPKGWPDLKSSETVKRGKDSYSIYLGGSHQTELIKLLSKLGDKQAVLINGKKWTLSYRPSFPGEKEWKNQKPVTDRE